MGEAKRRKAMGQYPDTTTPKAPVLGAKSGRGSEAVTWEVLGDLTEHPKSESVIELLEKLKREYGSFGGSTMLVTLEGAARTPIIKASVKGLSTFMALIGGMQDLGLIDRLVDAPSPERGIDAAFS